MNYATAAQANLFQLRRHAEDIQRPANPFPATVTLADFVKRDLNRAIAAGQIAVECSHPITPLLRCPVKAVERPSPLKDHYFIDLVNGKRLTRWSGLGILYITWHAREWKSLSWAMRYALRWFAGEGFTGQKKPRTNTLRALEKRGLVVNKQATPFALSLYQMHKGEFEIG